VRRPGDLDAGVVDERVQPAELGGRLPDHADGVVLLGDESSHVFLLGR
jgi:hypothetical protein